MIANLARIAPTLPGICPTALNSHDPMPITQF